MGLEIEEEPQTVGNYNDNSCPARLGQNALAVDIGKIMGRSRNDQRQNCQKQKHGDSLRQTFVEFLLMILHTADEEAQSCQEQEIRQYGSEERNTQHIQLSVLQQQDRLD